MSQTLSNKSILAISEFLSYLRLKGFKIGVDHYLRVQELLNRIAEDCPPENLKTLLCPLFATTKSQQEQFYKDFDSYVQLIAPEPPEPEVEKKSLWRNKWILILLIISLAAVAFLLTPERATSLIVQIISLFSSTTSSNGSPPLGDVSPTWFYLGGVIILALSLLAKRLARFIRRKRILRKQHEKRPPYTWPLKVNRPLIPIYNSDEIKNVARAMHRRQVDESQYLDINRTITATAEAAGFPDLRFKPFSKSPEYLVLIDRLSFRDHQSNLLDEMVRTLKREGLYAVWYFSENPQVCSNETGDTRISINELQARYVGRRLLIVGNGAGMIDPMTGELASWTEVFLRWKDRVVLTPHPPAHWGLREFTLAGLFIVSPATPKGLITLVDQLEMKTSLGLSYWSESDSETSLDDNDHIALTDSLRSYLGEPTFQWLCACAVYPEIQWDLTIYLGSLRCMGEGLVTEENLRQLVRLPWFRNGYIPDEIRWLLINEMDPVKEKCVRQALIELLEKNPPTESYKKTYAADQYQLNLTAQQWLYQNNRESLRKLLNLIKSLPPSQAFRDSTIPRFIEASSSLGHPKGLSRLFFIELLERFSFYSLLGLFVLYLRDPNQGFGWTDEQATSLSSTYLALIYFSPLIGGLLADSILGQRRTVMIGAIFSILGYALLSIHSLSSLYVALGCLIFGHGLFKPNISVMVGSLYPEGSHLKDRAYNIFYMGINIGAFLAPICMEIIKTRFGYRPAFAFATVGMMVSLGIFLRSKKYIRDTTENRVKKRPTEQEYKSAAFDTDIPPKAASYQKSKDPMFVRRIAALIAIFAVVIVFWMSYHQSYSTLIYWADENTRWPIKLSGTIATAINPFWVIMLTFPLLWFWKFLDKAGKEPSTPTKMAIGMMMTGASYFILYLAAKLGEAGAAEDIHKFQVSPAWLITSYGVLTLGELMLSPMGLSLVSKVAPIQVRGLMMGLWFAATAIGNKLTIIGVYWNKWQHSTFFAVLGILALVMTLVLLIILKPLKRAMPGV